MLSEDLRDFAACMAGWEDSGVELGPVAVRVLRAQITAYAAAAECLEQQVIPNHQRGDLPPEVARLDVERASRRRGRPGGAP